MTQSSSLAYEQPQYVVSCTDINATLVHDIKIIKL